MSALRERKNPKAELTIETASGAGGNVSRKISDLSADEDFGVSEHENFMHREKNPSSLELSNKQMHYRRSKSHSSLLARNSSDSVLHGKAEDDEDGEVSPNLEAAQFMTGNQSFDIYLDTRLELAYGQFALANLNITPKNRKKKELYGDLTVNPFTLKFDNTSVESKFSETYRKFTCTQIKVSTAVLSFILLVCFVIDAIVDYDSDTMIIRSLSRAAVLAFILITLYMLHFYEAVVMYSEVLASSFLILTGLQSIITQVDVLKKMNVNVVSDVKNQDMVVLLIITALMVSCHPFFRLRLPYTAMVCFTLTLMYLIVNLAVDIDAQLTGPILMLCFISLLSTITARFMEVHLRKDFKNLCYSFRNNPTQRRRSMEQIIDESKKQKHTKKRVAIGSSPILYGSPQFGYSGQKHVVDMINSSSPFEEANAKFDIIKEKLKSEGMNDLLVELDDALASIAYARRGTFRNQKRKTLNTKNMKILGSPRGIVGSYLETEINQGRYRNSVAGESNFWNQNHGYNRRHASFLTGISLDSAGSESSAASITGRNGSGTSFGSLLSSSGENPLATDNKIWLNEQALTVLREYMIDWNFGPGGLFARLTDPKLPEGFHENPLAMSSLAAFRTLGCVEGLSLDEQILSRLMVRVEINYKPRDIVTYHNALHALDVMQSIYCMLHEGKLLASLPDISVFAVLFGACIHDIAHPGTNNSYQIATSSELALRYNDSSVLENYHVSFTFFLLREDGLNILSSLSKDDVKLFRELIIEMVLATDLALHFEQINNFKAVCAAGCKEESDFPLDMNESSDNSLFCSILLHAADISCVAKDWDVYKQWIDMLFMEFYRQGDLEKSCGFEVAPFMDREKSSPAKAQQGFVKFLVMPLYEAINVGIPAIFSLVYPRIEVNLANLEKWEKASGDGMSSVKEELDQLPEPPAVVESESEQTQAANANSIVISME